MEKEDKRIETIAWITLLNDYRMNTCRRCGKEIKKSDLRCKECRKLVDEEIIERSVSRPLAFYFSNYYMYLYPKKK